MTAKKITLARKEFKVCPEVDDLLESKGYLGEAPQLSMTYPQFDIWHTFPHPLLDPFKLKDWEKETEK
jgi:hypothetical protein